MEGTFINRTEIQGFVGSIKVYEAGDGKVARFSVATQEQFSNRDGAVHIVTTWHNVTAWNKPGVIDIDSIKSGDCVNVVGHLRTQKYVGVDGCDHCVVEIATDKLKIVS